MGGEGNEGFFGDAGNPAAISNLIVLNQTK